VAILLANLVLLKIGAGAIAAGFLGWSLYAR
jgi:hypothetical protein